MPFDPAAYGPGIAAILATAPRMPLIHGAAGPAAARTAIAREALPDSARAGLYLYAGFWDEAHETAQSIEIPDGSYWHAIVHRQEPDAGNASYWFRRTGQHAIFPALAQRAAEIDAALEGRWDPYAFIDYCERAVRQGGELERRALAIQRAEWELLFDRCFNSASRG